jgi:hypothetical protein
MAPLMLLAGDYEWGLFPFAALERPVGRQCFCGGAGGSLSEQAPPRRRRVPASLKSRPLKRTVELTAMAVAFMNCVTELE